MNRLTKEGKYRRKGGTHVRYPLRRPDENSVNQYLSDVTADGAPWDDDDDPLIASHDAATESNSLEQSPRE